MTTDPSAGIPNASDDEYAAAVLETPQERAARTAREDPAPAARIRWTDNGMGGSDGHVGTSKRLMFELWQSPALTGCPPGDWVITSEFPLPDASSLGYTYAFSGKDPGELRARAERRLAEFASSLGAAFPEEPERPSRTWHADWVQVDRDQDGNAILRHKPTGGMYKIMPAEEC